MADVKVIVKQMKDAGMTENEILSNLQELGIENPEEQMSAALKEIQPAKKAKSTTSGSDSPIQITRVDGEREQTVDIGRIIENGTTNDEGNGENGLMKRVASTNISNTDDMEDKLDQIIALLKALQDVNKKILETNRDLLLKMGKRPQQENEKPQLGNIF